MNRRRLLLAAGFALFAVSLAELVRPGVSPIPGDDLLLTVVGAVALLYAVAGALARRGTGPERVETPDVELPEPAAVPGGDLATVLRQFPGAESVYSGVATSRVGGLRRAAVAVLSRYRGLDTAEARRQVAGGTWTDDPDAARLLAERSLSSGVGQRLRRFVSPDSGRRRSLDRTVDAIATVAGVPEDGESPGQPGTTTETGTTHLTGRTVVRRRTRHWAGVSVVVLACLAVGLLLEEPGVLLAGVVAVGYAAYAQVGRQTPVNLSAARSVSNSEPDPGEEVTVRVTVTNEGGFCPDLRIVDGVPESLAVTDGSPRRGARLPAEESVTFSYTVRARQGTHEFGPTQVVARNLSNSTERELVVGSETTLTAVPPLRAVQESVPLRRQPTQYAGRAPTDSGGEGIEFHTVREYKPGDSMARIDWNRRARTGELTTLEFRRERATRVVLLVDARPAASVGHDPLAMDAAERSVAASQRLFPALLAEGHQVGIAAFGPQECYLAPDTGTSHQQRGRDLLATDPAFRAGSGPERERRLWVRQLRKRLPGNTQLLLFSPLLEERTVRVVRELEAYGYPTTVLSPDPTATETPSQRLMRARRRVLMTDLRQTGVPVLDWPPETPLAEILRREVATR
jgi:uncharacterized protein (DUF58 family)